MTDRVCEDVRELGKRSVIEMLPFLDQALYILHEFSVKVKDF